LTYPQGRRSEEPFNDAPSFELQASPDKTVLQNAGAQSVSKFATNISAGPANESDQTLNFQVSNTNNSLFSAQPAVSANGTLTYTPATGAIGNATVTVTLKDNGGTANGGIDTSAAQTFKITVKYNFSGFLTRIPKSSYKAGSTIPVKFTLADAAGTRISDAEAQALVASPCKVKVLFSGGTPTNNCASYNATTGTFQYNL
jgi:hypothetical protein